MRAERELEERRRRKEEEQLQQEREARLRRELHELHQKERTSLEQQLTAERSARQDDELRMRAEIRRLEAQLARLGISPSRASPRSGGSVVSPREAPSAGRRSGPASVASPVSEQPEADLVATVNSLLGGPARALQLCEYH